MRSSIVPLSSIDPELLYNFLGRRGNDRAHVRWKYFDESFNQGRERGWVWYRQGLVKGFIGMIPATLATPGGDREMVWTCDWILDEQSRNPGMGILLLKTVQDSHDYTCGVGGSDDTHSLVPRMNTCTVADTAIFLHRPLTLSPLLSKVEERVSFLPRLSRGPLGRIKVPSRGSASSAIAQAGLAPELAPLFDRPAEQHCRVRYDAGHLEWLGRCPGLSVRSATDADEASALFWSREADPTYWRAVFRALPGRAEALDRVVRRVVRDVAAQGGTLMTTIISHLDEEQLPVFMRNRFLQGSQRWPMYIPRKDEPGSCEQGFSDMSYLDTDLATLF